MVNGSTNIHVFDRGILIGQCCKDEILAPYVRYFCGAYLPNFVFIDDNGHQHKVQLMDEYLESEDIQ